MSRPLTRRRALVAAASFAAAATAMAQEAPMPREFSPAALKALHEAMEMRIAQHELPGIVTALARGPALAIDALGAQEFDGPRPMRRDTIFRIASLSKPVAGVAAMMLVEDGKLALDAPVERWLPELANRRVLKRLDSPIDDTEPAARPILVSDLLTQLMGIGAIMTPGEYPILRIMAEKGIAIGPHLPVLASDDEYMRLIGSIPLMRQPGTTWLYDTGIHVLGVLIARAAGQKLGDVLAERIFAPLGMRDTGFFVPAAKLDRLPTCYVRDPQTGAFSVFDSAGPESRFAQSPGFASAAGGLVSTADDYIKFARLMLNTGEIDGKRLLSAPSVAAMTTDHITPAQKEISPFVPGFWDKRGWGYALSIVTKDVPGEPRGFGWDGGYGTSCYWDPKSGVIGLLLTQRLMDSPQPPPVFTDFWRHAYAG